MKERSSPQILSTRGFFHAASHLDLGVRERLGINVVGIIKNGKIEVAINPQEPLREKEILIVIGSNDILEKFDMKNR